MSIPIPPASYTLSERVTFLCQLLKPYSEWADVVRLLQSKDKETRHKPRANKAKRVELVGRDGRKVKGKAAYVNMANEQIEYIET